MSIEAQISLKGKTAFISGASRGIGAEITRLFAAAGAELALTGRDTAALRDVVESARSQGVGVWFETAELSDAGQVRELGVSTLEAVGKVDILVNNAGVGIPARFAHAVQPTVASVAQETREVGANRHLARHRDEPRERRLQRANNVLEQSFMIVLGFRERLTH